MIFASCPSQLVDQLLDLCYGHPVLALALGGLLRLLDLRVLRVELVSSLIQVDAEVLPDSMLEPLDLPTVTA